ncbi:Rha family transcriptional regulator [Paenibacillus oleatilyticus]|uniref:Rha family transcriptional regulator n=1 Tax=Paenibacillus oleatilyticus TaxID=2594886 RepID=UPI001C1FA3D9|nr:Rha family transcriptional regulator [Paenibacillus oleatilyticus]MBU7316002.1 Rha family transcriptional regulator [Paenibacillus oleatilyticus]
MDFSVINFNGKLYVDSRDVAAMVEKEHDQLMRSIRTYVEYMESAKLQSRDFFIQSKYINSQNKEQPCYFVTRKGCDMIANKMTGEKGVLFTAAYVTKFEEMEKKLLQLSPLEVMQLAINQLVDHEKELKNHEKEIDSLKHNDLKLTEGLINLRENFEKYTIRTGDKSGYIVARELKLFSSNDNPHFNFVDAVAKKLNIYSGNLGDRNEYVNVIMENTHNGNSGVAVYYTATAVHLIQEYLSENFKLDVIPYQRNTGEFKKGEPKEFVFKLNNKNWQFNKKTYEHFCNELGIL